MNNGEQNNGNLCLSVPHHKVTTLKQVNGNIGDIVCILLLDTGVYHYKNIYNVAVVMVVMNLCIVIILIIGYFKCQDLHNIQ